MDCLQADADDEADDVLLIVFSVGVGNDAAPFVGGDLVLVDDPLQGGTVAEAVFESFRRDAGEGQRGIHGEAELVLGEAHLVFHPVRERNAGRFDEIEVPGLQLFIIEVQPGKLLPRLGEGAEFGGERNPRQLAIEVIGVLLAIAVVVQQPIDVMEGCSHLSIFCDSHSSSRKRVDTLN